MYPLFHQMRESDKSAAIKKLITDGTPDADFFFMTVLSALMATFGLLIDNTPVLIGSMLIAPLLLPVLSASMGIVMADGALITRSVYTLIRALAYGIGASSVVALLFFQWGGDAAALHNIASWQEVSLSYFFIAVIAGLAASYALAAHDSGPTLPGVAIAVTLIPPVAAVGIGMARFDWALISGALTLLTVNILGIVFSGLVMFSLLNFALKRTVAKRAVKENDKEK